MPSRRRPLWLYAGLGLATALLLSFLAGMLTERLRYDRERTVVLERLEAARRTYHQRLIDADRPGDGAEAAIRPDRARRGQP